MTDQSPDLFGQEGILADLVADCVGYPHRRPRRRDLPVVMLLGPRGAGKTDRLQRIGRLHAGIVPCAHLDLADETFRRPLHGSPAREALIRLRFDLSQRRKHFGRLRFPRLKLGLLAIDSPVDLNNRERALAEIRKVVDSDERMQKVIDFVHDDLPEIVRGQRIPQLPPGANHVLAIALRGLAPIVVRRLFLGRALSWYREQVTGTFHDPYDALISLNEQNRLGADSQHTVDEILFSAFIADLYADFNKGLAHWDRVANCLVLLDNVDTEAGESFVDLLVGARHKHSRQTQDRCDPLAVIAARRRHTGRSIKEALEATPDDASYNHWHDRRSQQRSSWLYLVELRNLTLEEIERAVQEADLHHIPREFAHFIHDLTQGHPGTVRLLIDSVRAQLEQDPSDLDLRNMFDLPAAASPQDPGVTVGERALEGLLRSMNVNQRHDLATFAAAGDMVSASRLERPGTIAAGSTTELRDILSTDLWLNGSGTGTELEIVPHGLLRRLLHWELARRPEDARDNWVAVHSRLRHYHDNGAAAAEVPTEISKSRVRTLRHALALGDLGTVTRSFDETFQEGSIARWLETFHAVTTAPNRLQAQTAMRNLSPLDQVKAMTQDLAGGNARAQAIARLTAAAWIAADPLIVADRELLSLIVTELKHLAHLAGHEFKVLFDEAQRYEALKETWRL